MGHKKKKHPKILNSICHFFFFVLEIFLFQQYMRIEITNSKFCFQVLFWNIVAWNVACGPVWFWFNKKIVELYFILFVFSNVLFPSMYVNMLFVIRFCIFIISPIPLASHELIIIISSISREHNNTHSTHHQVKYHHYNHHTPITWPSLFVAGVSVNASKMILMAAKIGPSPLDSNIAAFVPD